MDDNNDDSDLKPQQMDPIEAATYKAQRDAEARLRTQQVTVPGLPPPRDMTWVNAQFHPTSAIPAPTTAPRPIIARADGSVPAPLKPRAYTGRPRARLSLHEQRVEKGIGTEAWGKVADRYAVTGDETQIAIDSELTLEQVEHILDRGIRRVGLPPSATSSPTMLRSNARSRSMPQT